MNEIEKSKHNLPVGKGTLTGKLTQASDLSAGLAAAFGSIELPRQFNQLVIFVLDGSGSMTWDGSSGKSKGYEVHQSVIKVLERLKQSKNVASFDTSFIAYAEETVQMFPVRTVKECDLVKDCYNPCEHISLYKQTMLREAIEMAGTQAQTYCQTYSTGITKTLILLLSDGVIHDHAEALQLKEQISVNNQIHFATIFFESPHYEKQYGLAPANVSRKLAQFASSESDHTATVDPEVIRSHMIKSITKVSRIDPQNL
jgi:hypothetical protein